MMLYIVRHAQAVAAEKSGTDAERPLTQRGVAQMHRLGHALRLAGVSPSAVITSPLARAEESAGILMQELGEMIRLEVSGALSPGRNGAEALAAIPQRHVPSVMIVGHEPQLSEMVMLLVTGGYGSVMEPAEASVTCLECEGVPASGKCSMKWHLTPQVVDPLVAKQETYVA